MKWLNDKELQSEKYDWVGGGREGVDEFRGKIQDELAMIDTQITTIIENELNQVNGKFIGGRINEFVCFLKNDHHLKRFIRECPDISNKLKVLNKVRVFAAHGISYINAKTGKEVVLIKENKGASEGLLFDKNLLNEVEELFQSCSILIANIQTELGYFDDETGSFRYFSD